LTRASAVVVTVASVASLARRRTSLAALGVVLLTACSAGGGAPVAGAETRSLGEYDLARDAFQGNRFREALDHVQKSLKLNEDNAEAAYLGSVILFQFCAIDEHSSDCRFNDAEHFAREALRAAPDHRDAKNALGVILIHEKRYDDAIGVLKPLADDILYNTPEKAWGNLGWAYLERGSVEEAIDALRRSVAAQPLFCVGNFRLGLAFEKKGDLPLAREALSKAVDTDRPECKRLQDAWSARARVLAKQGAKDDARADLQKCSELSATTPIGLRCKADLQTYQ
jgi:Tfp pilus assembly protein PilF